MSPTLFEPPVRRSRLGFTLIELLVVIAIIGILIGLLVPAVQKVRESAARLQCSNNIKQWALAMHGYHDATKRLPFGSRNSPRQTWVMYLWPFVEQTALANQSDFTKNFYEAPFTIQNSMSGLTGAGVPIYNCPSDIGYDQDDTGQTYPRRRGNYMVNWGNATFGSPAPGPGGAPFAHINGDQSKPRTTKINQITDGTSNTYLLGEYIKAAAHQDTDWRGDIHNNEGVFRFHTLTTPNSSAADIVNQAQPDANDKLAPVTTNGSQFNTARSRHSGGVNMALCDGSVRFTTNDILLSTFKAMGTMDGGETEVEIQ